MSLKCHSKATSRKKKVLAIRSIELNVKFEFDVRGLNQLVKRLFCWHYRLQFFNFLRIMESVKELTKLLSSIGDLQLQKTSCITKKKNLEVLNEERTKKVKSDQGSKFFNLKGLGHQLGMRITNNCQRPLTH